MLFFSEILNFIGTGFIWLLFYSRGRVESVFSPLFWYLLFHTLIFLIRPILTHALGLSMVFGYMRIVPSDALLSETHLVALFGLVAFALGHLAVTSKMAFFQPSSFDPSISKSALLVVWSVLGSIAAYSTVHTGVGLVDASKAILMDQVNGQSINVDQNGYLLDAQMLFVGLCAILACFGRFSVWSLLPTLIFFAYRSFVGWGRWSIVLTALALGLLQLYRSGRKWPPRKFLIAALPFLVLFVLLGQDRGIVLNVFKGGSISDSSFSWTSVAAVSEDILDGLDFANFEYLAYVLRAVPDETETFTYGTQYLQLFTEPIPRVWWPAKPVGSPIQLFSLNDYGNFSSLTVSIVGDGWMTFGYAGVFVVLFVAGCGFGTLYRRFGRRTVLPRHVISYCCVCALYVQYFRDGTLVSMTKFTVFVLLPVWAVYLLTDLMSSRLKWHSDRTL